MLNLTEFYKEYCAKCINNATELCESCRDNIKYRDYPTSSYHQEYKPTCRRGCWDCVCDPAYILYHYPEWYKEMYGDKIFDTCPDYEPDDWGYCENYDDEDK